MKISVLFSGLFLLLASASTAQVPTELTQLLGSDTDAHDQFGAAISVSGQRMVVGAPYDRGLNNDHGSAYVFERYSTAREGWEEVTKLKASQASFAELFGSSVAIDGDTIAIGALVQDDQTQSGESVYVYQRDLEGLKSWNQVAQLRPSAPETLTSFGAAIALDDRTLAVGAPEDSSSAASGGAVYLFELSEDGNWHETMKLTAQDADPFDAFGFSLALHGRTLIVGAPNSESEGLGSVHVFRRSPAGTWHLATKLQPGASSRAENFGWSVDLHEQTLVIGAPTFRSERRDRGSAFVYERLNHEVWHQIALLEPVGNLGSKHFGSAVALNGDLILVGDPNDSERAAGAAHVFARDQGGNNNWGGLYKMQTDSAGTGDRFGQAVDLGDSVLAVGSDLKDAAGVNSGLAHLFLRGVASATPKLWIPQEIPTTTGLRVEVPIYFEHGGADISATTFEIDFDEYCLDLDDADDDFDGIPDDIQLHLPPGLTVQVNYDEGDYDGELEFAILDLFPPLSSLPEGEIATIIFTATCPAYVDASLIAPVAFTQTPHPSFGTADGQSQDGRWHDGSVEILGGDRGDCNRDLLIDAGDLPACVLEIFDGDGGFWVDASSGGFFGSPIGCDANADQWIDAGDLSCKLLLIFQDSAECESKAPDVDRERSQGPILTMGRVQGRYNRPIEVPVFFDPGKAYEINTLAFSIPLDPRLRFRANDKDEDGIPDDIQINLPRSTVVSVDYVSEPSPRLDLVIIEPNTRIARYLREPLLTFTVFVPKQDGVSRIPLDFGDAPFASYGSTTGRSVAGQNVEGEMFIRP